MAKIIPRTEIAFGLIPVFAITAAEASAHRVSREAIGRLSMSPKLDQVDREISMLNLSICV